MIHREAIMIQELKQLENGDRILWDVERNAIYTHFTGKRKVVSTSLINGGYREDLEGVFNYNCGGPHDPCMSLAEYEVYLKKVASDLGLLPERACGFGTAAQMKNAAVVTETYRKLEVTACVTAGVEGNAGCAGDPAGYYGAEDNPELMIPGTINILLFLNANMPAGILTRALVTCTEGKTAALRNLLVGSRYSENPATGTGTDSTAIICDPGSPLYFRGAGKHSKLGELIGRAVTKAVTIALEKQNGLTPAVQHSVLSRLRRYGVTAKSLWEIYHKEGGTGSEADFLSALQHVETNPTAILASSLYAELLDEYRWHLDSIDETRTMAESLLQMIARALPAKAAPIQENTLTGFVRAMEETLLSGLSLCERKEKP